MICSMTAFADHQLRSVQYAIRWEIRSVNSRYLDLTLRLPDNLRFLEPAIRNQVGQELKRGKVECNLRLDLLPDATFAFQLNHTLLKTLIVTLNEIAPMLTRDAPVSPLDVASWPGVIKEPEADHEMLGGSALEGLQAALEKLVEARRREGGKLAEFIRRRSEELRAQVLQARRLSPEAMAAMGEKIRARVLEISAEPDRDRMEQELVYLCQKMDVAEECDRLDAHLDEIERLLAGDQPVGRRLDFLCQEMNREANTLAAKAASTPLTQCAIEMKVLIEQMREQVQNIE